MFSEDIRPTPAFRVGVVQQQEAATARVRVVFADLDQMTSYWLPVVVQKSQNDKAYWMPDVGEQVVCLMDSRYEAGAVLGAIYSEADTAPVASADKFHLGFKDGAAFEYDRALHALSVALPAGATLSIAANGATIAIDASGNVNLTAAGKIKLGTSGKGVARLGDQVTVGGSVGTITSASATVEAAD